MTERRAAPRMRMFKAGKIFLGTRSVGCTVRNLSDTGACLEFDSAYGIPATFDFVLPERCHRMCKVVWTNGGRMGVQFR
jgi:PilZ domain-containing protein